MSFTELILASLSLAGTATSGLHVWGQASLAAHVGFLKEEQLEPVELQLLAASAGCQLLAMVLSCLLLRAVAVLILPPCLVQQIGLCLCRRGLSGIGKLMGLDFGLRLMLMRLRARLLSRFDVVSCLRPRVLVGAGPI